MVEISERALGILRESWLLLGQMSPYLLFGFLVAGILSVCVSPAWVERHLGRPGLGSVLKASLFGVPLPLCSCGVIPVSASIRRHGASRAATTAFLLSTPQTGVDSIAVTFGSLGLVFAIFRPIAALLTGLIGGTLVQIFVPSASADVADESKSAACQEPCCSQTAPRNVLLRVLNYGFVTLPRDIGGALLVGVVIAGAMAALVRPDQWEIGGGILAILLLMAASVPIYVCATASVPIAYALMYVGVSPGAALAFLIAGPATNAATFTTIWKLLGRRTALLYVTTVAFGAIASGLLLDGLFPDLKASMPRLGSPAQQTAEHAQHAGQIGWLTQHLAAVALLAIMMISSKTMARLMKGKKLLGKEEDHTDASPAGRRLELVITGMTCSHCAQSVRRALAECDRVGSVEVDLAGGRAVVTGDRLDPARITAAVAQLGYTASLCEEGSS